MKFVQIIVTAAASAVVVSSAAAPIRSSLGADDMPAEEGGGVPYVADGLVHWWDGLVGSWDGSSWIDIIGGHSIAYAPQGEGYAEITAIKSGGRARSSCYPFGEMNRDFTIHCFFETVKASQWTHWCQIGIGKGDGFQNGLVCDGTKSLMAVNYRAKYSGTVLNSVPLTGVRYGDIIVLDIVFHYDPLVYEVYVNGNFVGASQISKENWNLDGQLVHLGTDFYSLYDNNKNLKRYNILFYDRALDADEIAHNYQIDQERFGL